MTGTLRVAVLGLLTWSAIASAQLRMPADDSSILPADAQIDEGSVEGTVTFEGAAPAAAPVDMSSDPYCAGIAGSTQVRSRPIEVDARGGLLGVVVSVRGLAPSGARGSASEPIVLDQKDCMYRPPVLALIVNQPLLIRNSDGTMHNVHVRARANRSFNLGQPLKGLESRRSFSAAEVGISVSCDVHGWMSGAIAVFNHPYFAVTGPEGSFTIAGLPAGEHTLEAWHPTLGVQTVRVSIPAAGTGKASFVFRSP